MDADRIQLSAEIACLLEVTAEKPGNVTRRHDTDDKSFEDFLVSAVAIGPAIRDAGSASVGETVLSAVRSTHRLVKTNTNLGIVLLLAPLAKAAALKKASDDLRTSVRSVLNSLTVHDTRMVYEAIRLANAAGLGTVNHFDVRQEDVNITLLEAMEHARDRDSLAREYATDFEITFEIGLPALRSHLEGGAAGVLAAIVQTFLAILASEPDTLIARKNGLDAARKISDRARYVLQQGGVFTDKGRAETEKLDLELRDEKHTLSPGTTADLVAAVLFVYLLENDLPHVTRRLCPDR